MTDHGRVTKKLSISVKETYPQRNTIFEYDSPEDANSDFKSNLTTEHFIDTERYRSICKSLSKFSNINHDNISTSLDSKNQQNAKEKPCKIENKDRNWLKRMLCWKHINGEGKKKLLKRKFRKGRIWSGKRKNCGIWSR